MCVVCVQRHCSTTLLVVSIHTHACNCCTGINASDINFTAGRYFGSPEVAAKRLPFDAGFEAAGAVAAAGPDVSGMHKCPSSFPDRFRQKPSLAVGAVAAACPDVPDILKSPLPAVMLPC